MLALQDGEKIVCEVRRHWYVLIVESLIILLVFLLPAFIAIASAPWILALGVQTYAMFIFLTSGWLLVGWLVFFIVWTNYYLDVWVITNRRILDVEQKGLFSREISEFRLDRLQDITIEVSGILATFLHFGDIHVQTAGQMSKFIMRNAPNPDEVKNIIFKMHDEFMAHEPKPSE